MAFTLKASLPDGYWHHNSGGEHAMKHSADSGEINAVRQARGLSLFDNFVMEERLFEHGLSVVRPLLGRSGVGGVAGYLVADRSPGVIDIQDMYVLRGHRNRGVGGYLLGQFLTATDYNLRGPLITSYHGEKLRINERTYALPGLVISTDRESLGPDYDRFMQAMPAGWNGVRSVSGDGGSHTVFRHGEEVAQLEALDGRQFRVVGQEQAYEHIVFAAIAALNPKDKVLSE